MIHRQTGNQRRERDDGGIFAVRRVALVQLGGPILQVTKQRPSAFGEVAGPAENVAHELGLDSANQRSGGPERLVVGPLSIGPAEILEDGAKSTVQSRR
jgi:hypothetical protein